MFFDDIEDFFHERQLEAYYLQGMQDGETSLENAEFQQAYDLGFQEMTSDFAGYPQLPSS